MSVRRGVAVLAIGALASVLIPAPARAQPPAVLLVGAPGTPGAQFSSIQAAVDQAHPGDWVLVAPGVYHEKGSDKAGVLITRPGVHLRGMNRNTVVVDGTNPSGGAACGADPAVQDLGPVDPATNQPGGRNGIEVLKADGTSIENLTVCNYLSSAGGDNGNQIWWNGGDRSGQIALHSFSGAYLTATSTYFKDSSSAMAQYGIFTSNEGGPGTIDQAYASNMGDSDFYIGACPDCNVVLSHVHAENSSLGYSGTNSGGRLVIENSEWDHNKVGLAPNSLNNDDRPSPQVGACPPGATPPPGAQNCTVLRDNFVHDNNNPDTPQTGISGAAPVGTGIELSGTQDDSVVDNRVEGNGSWGIVAHDFPDTETPPPGPSCQGGVSAPGNVCLFRSGGNEVVGNRLAGNGSNANPTNGDLAVESTGVPPNCFRANVDTGGTLTSDPPGLQSIPCPQPGDEVGLSAQLVCASQAFGSCPALPGATYPRGHGDAAVRQGMTLPPSQATMPDPCAATPPNACPSASPAAARSTAPAPQAVGVLSATGGGDGPAGILLCSRRAGGTGARPSPAEPVKRRGGLRA